MSFNACNVLIWDFTSSCRWQTEVLHREVQAEQHQSNNVHYWRKDHRARTELGWEVSAAVTGIKWNLLHAMLDYMAIRAPGLHKYIFCLKSKQTVSLQSAGSEVKQWGCSYMKQGLTKGIILSATFNLEMWIHESLGVLLMAWGPAVSGSSKMFHPTKELLDNSQLNSQRKSRNSPGLRCSSWLKARSNEYVSACTEVLLRAPSLTKLHPRYCP